MTLFGTPDPDDTLAPNVTPPDRPAWTPLPRGTRRRCDACAERALDAARRGRGGPPIRRAAWRRADRRGDRLLCHADAQDERTQR